MRTQYAPVKRPTLITAPSLVVVVIRRHHIACPPTVKPDWPLKRAKMSSPSLSSRSSSLFPDDGGQPARGRELENRVLRQRAHGEMLSACTKTPSCTHRPEMLVAASSRAEGRKCLLFGIIETAEFGARDSDSQAEDCSNKSSTRARLMHLSAACERGSLSCSRTLFKL